MGRRKKEYRSLHSIEITISTHNHNWEMFLITIWWPCLGDIFYILQHFSLQLITKSFVFSIKIKNVTIRGGGFPQRKNRLISTSAIYSYNLQYCNICSEISAFSPRLYSPKSFQNLTVFQQLGLIFKYYQSIMPNCQIYCPDEDAVLASK